MHPEGLVLAGQLRTTHAKRTLPTPRCAPTAGCTAVDGRRAWPAGRLIGPEAPRAGRHHLEHEQGRELVGGYRTAEQVALDLVAAVRAQELQLLVGLDALGHHAQPEGLGEGDDADGEGGGGGIVTDAELGYEGLVDLDLVDRKRT